MRPLVSSILVAAFATSIVAGRLAAELSPAPPASLEAQSAHGMPAPARGAAKGRGVEGKVVETMDSGGYTYIRMEWSGNERWVAVPPQKVSLS